MAGADIDFKSRYSFLGKKRQGMQSGDSVCSTLKCCICDGRLTEIMGLLGVIMHGNGEHAKKEAAIVDYSNALLSYNAGGTW